jgi:hypothetical protein
MQEGTPDQVAQEIREQAIRVAKQPVEMKARTA